MSVCLSNHPSLGSFCLSLLSDGGGAPSFPCIAGVLWHVLVPAVVPQSQAAAPSPAACQLLAGGCCRTSAQRQAGFFPWQCLPQQTDRVTCIFQQDPPAENELSCHGRFVIKARRALAAPGRVALPGSSPSHGQFTGHSTWGFQQCHRLSLHS